MVTLFFSSSLPSTNDNSRLLRRQSVHGISPLPRLGMPPVLANMHSELLLLLLEATLNTASPPFFCHCAPAEICNCFAPHLPTQCIFLYLLGLAWP
jgi:hypothetical protein